jgi:hypothetical protein
MSTPDVRVRLSAEGIREVQQALSATQRQADRVNETSKRGFDSLRGAIRSLGAVAAVGGLAAFARSALNAADAAGKAAAAVGATVEEYSALAFASETADVSTEQLRTGLTFLTRSLGELERGTGRQTQAFARLGLTARDFAGRSTGEAFDIVARKLGALENSAQRTRLAVELFGRSGAQLLPLLQDVAEQGLDGVAEAARRAGVLIDSDLANAAAAANDSFVRIRQSARGVATAFLSGLAPSIAAAMEQVSDSIQTDGVDKLRSYGQETGRILRTVVSVFQLFGTTVSAVIRGLGDQIGGFAALVSAGLGGRFSEAASIWRDLGDRGRVDFEKFREDFSAGLNQVIAEANRDAPPVKVRARPEFDAEIPPTVDRAAGRAAADREAERLRREAERAAQEQLRREEAAAQARFITEQQLLELTGRGREAALRALDEELAKRRATLELAGQLTQADLDRFDQIRARTATALEANDLGAQIRREFEDLALARQRIEQDVELGITTQREGQRQIAALEASRLPVLEQIVEQLRAAAAASGDPALIAEAERLELQYRQVAIAVAKAGDALARFREDAEQAVTADLTSWLTDGIREAKNFEAAVKSLADSIIASLARIAAEAVAKDIASAIFGGGAGGGILGSLGRFLGLGGVRAATGGLIAGRRLMAEGGKVSGPGGPTADVIPAWLSNGEFVVRQAAVAQPGMLDLLRRINGLQLKPVRYATGGLVGGTTESTIRTAAVGGMTVHNHFQVNAPDGRISRATEEQIAAAAARGLARAARRSG